MKPSYSCGSLMLYCIHILCARNSKTFIFVSSHRIVTILFRLSQSHINRNGVTKFSPKFEIYASIYRDIKPCAKASILLSFFVGKYHAWHSVICMARKYFWGSIKKYEGNTDNEIKLYPIRKRLCVKMGICECLSEVRGREGIPKPP